MKKIETFETERLIEKFMRTPIGKTPRRIEKEIFNRIGDQWARLCWYKMENVTLNLLSSGELQ